MLTATAVHCIFFSPMGSIFACLLNVRGLLNSSVIQFNIAKGEEDGRLYCNISLRNYLPTGKEIKLLVMWISKHLLLYLTFLVLFFFFFFLSLPSNDSWLFSLGMSLLFPRGPNVSYSTNVCVTGCQGFSRSVAPGPARNAVGWKAVRGAIVARVCPPVRLSADLSSHCHLTGQTRGGGKKEKNG